MNRRELLKGAAAGGAAAWIAPSVIGVGMARADGSNPPETEPWCLDGGLTPLPTSLTFEYTQTQSADVTEWPPALQVCDETMHDWPDMIAETSTVTLRATWGMSNCRKDPSGHSTEAVWHSIELGDTITIGNPTDGFIEPEADGTTNNGRINPNVRLEVIEVLADESTEVILQTVCLHTSCSAPLHIGDRFGAFELAGGTVGPAPAPAEPAAESTEPAAESTEPAAESTDPDATPAGGGTPDSGDV